MAWNCKTPCDYIEKSLTLHPNLMEEHARRRAKIHREHAAITFNEAARQSALRMAEQCDAIALQTRNVYVDEVHTPPHVAECMIAGGVSLWVQAFSIAAYLNCIGHLTQSIVAEFPNGK
jgi:hypothetical protein